MTTTQSGPASADGASSGVLGGRPLIAQTFHGGDPDTVAAAAICSVTPTKCQARTRLYRDGTLAARGFPGLPRSATTWPTSRSPRLARPARPRPRRPGGAE